MPSSKFCRSAQAISSHRTRPSRGIKVGQKAKIKVDTFADRAFDGVIEQINTQGEFTPRNVQSRNERNHLVFGVKVRIDNREGLLKPGMAAEVTIEK
jgi:HlyD family secretion protein